MSKNDWSKKSTVPVLEKILLSSKIPVIMPDEVLDKIKYLCKSSPRFEWSGILFYVVEGSIKDISKMKIILKDILLMDKGTSVYTSFDWDEDIIEYRMNNPESLDWLVGHIHSHNTMDVFFSGTDWDELNDNCPQHNFYLSVIVNNYLDMVGKIAFTAQPNRYVCKDETGKDYTLSLTGGDIDPFMFVYDCEISASVVEITVSDDFKSRWAKIDQKSKEAAEKAEKERLAKLALANKQSAGKSTFFSGNHSTANYPNPAKQSFPGYDAGKKAHQLPLTEAWKENLEGEDEDLDLTDFTTQTIEQEFATYVLRLGNEIEDDELVSVLEDLSVAEVNSASLAQSIVESYGAFHDRFFEKIKKYQGDEAFLSVLEEVIDIYTEYEKDYPVLNQVVVRLKELGMKFENFQKQNVIS